MATPLTEFSIEQEKAVNETATKARQLLRLKPHFDLESWYVGLQKEHPYFKGVSFREFGAAVLGTPFRNT